MASLSGSQFNSIANPNYLKNQQPYKPIQNYGPSNRYGLTTPVKQYTVLTPPKGPTALGRSGGGSSGGGGGSSSGSSKSSAELAAEKLRGQISSGWDSYINSLDDQLAGLTSSRTAQEGIVNNQYNQGVNNLGLQLSQGNQALESNRNEALQNQTNNLRDISGNIRNAFQAGNVYLGSRGAGDSSASDQYSYALNKMGTQQRSNVMTDTAKILADINARGTNLQNIYNTEINNLGEMKNQKINEIAQWFADAQNQVRNLKSQGKLNKEQDIANLSKDLLNQALSAINNLNQYALNKRAALDQWAMGISDNIDQLKSNMQGTYNTNYSLPQPEYIYSGPQIDSSGNISLNTSGGGGGIFSNEKDKNSLFGASNYLG